MKPITKILISLILVILTGPQFLNAQELPAREVVRKAHDLANGKSSKGKMSMTIVRPTWTREVTLKSWSMGMDYYIIYITAPAKDEGQVFLKRQTEMWNWMPNINRMIKIPPSMMSQSWMGSDFTNDDLVRMNSIIDDFTHSYAGSESIDGFDCYKIELIPKPDAAVVWGKIILYIAKKEYYEMKAEYYDEEGQLINIMTASEIKQFGNRKLPSVLTMSPADKPGNMTIMKTIEMDFDIPIDESFFSQQNMKTIR
jgi:outer membrane lipoprotein-sorting protein